MISRLNKSNHEIVTGYQTILTDTVFLLLFKINTINLTVVIELKS